MEEFLKSDFESWQQLSRSFETRGAERLRRILELPLNSPLTSSLAPSECCQKEVLKLRALLEKYDDLRYMSTLAAAAILKSQGSAGVGAKRKRTSEVSVDLIANIYCAFYGLTAPSFSKLTLKFGFLTEEKKSVEKSDEYINANLSERRSLTNNTVLCLSSERCFRNAQSKLWTAFVSMPMGNALELHFLSNLGAAVIPSLSHPLNLADYLISSFDNGGLIGILSLHALFILIVDHDLEYPAFFDQLYSLLTPDSFSSRHRVQMFELITLALKSSTVSAQIVAAFIKRLSRVALLAPTPSLYVLPLIRSLLQDHPNCIALIQRRVKDVKESGSEAQMKLFEGEDCYDPEAPIESCHALDSTLWELMLLERHYSPGVSLMVSALSSTSVDTAPLKFQKTYGRLFTAEVTKDLGRITAAYEAPEKVFSSTRMAGLLSI